MREIAPQLMLAAVCLLAACGSSPPDMAAEADSADDSPVNLVERDPNRPLVLAFGDSLTRGLGVEQAGSYPSQLQERLHQEGYPHQVINDGEDGLTTSMGLARLDRALALEPDIVIVEVGANDGLRGLSLDAARDNLRVIVRAFRDGGAKVMLAGLTLPRNYGPDYIHTFETMYADLADELDVPLIPFFLAGLVDLEDPIASIGTLMQADGTHPTAAGYTIVADTVFNAIRPWLGDPM